MPEELYEVLRRRARRAGQSMQAYIRDQLVALAVRPTKEEAIERIEAVLGDLRTGGPTAASTRSATCCAGACCEEISQRPMPRYCCTPAHRSSITATR